MSDQNHSFYSPLRYPGGKGNLANFMKRVVLQNGLSDGEYAEVYAGGAGIAWSLLLEEYVTRIHINDLDESVYEFWHAVLFEANALCDMIENSVVTIEEWYRQKAVQSNLDSHTGLEIGFSTFFLNRTNRSGILRAGVIGGKAQAGKWKLDVRFNKPDLIRRIRRIAQYAGRVELYNQDAALFIATTLPRLSDKTIVYFDPPYFHKGEELYSNFYTHNDHATIAKLISSIDHPWLVSYDATPEIEELYSDYRKINYNIIYTAQRKYAGAEVMFCSNDLQIPSNCDPSSVTRKDIQSPFLSDAKDSRAVIDSRQ